MNDRSVNAHTQPAILLTSAADQYTVAPGDSLELPLSLKNLGAAPDQVRISVEGVPLPWISTQQPLVQLQPGEERSLSLTIQPPVPPVANAGRFNLRLRAASTLDLQRSAETLVTLTVAGFEVKGRLGVLLNALKYTATPGKQLIIPVVLINQGLGIDTLHLTAEGLPEGWVAIPTPDWRLEAGELASAMLILQPPRDPTARAGRRTFSILVASQQAPDQNVKIDCVLTVAPFTEFKSNLAPAAPEQDLPERVRVHNLSNMPATFRVSWSSPENALAFDPAEPQSLSLPVGETGELPYKVAPARRLWVGNEVRHPYKVAVQAAGGQPQTLAGEFSQKGLVPVWAAAVTGGALLLCCLCLATFFVYNQFFAGRSTPTPTPQVSLTPSATFTPAPTATQSQIDQRPLLVERNWFLVSYNNVQSLPGAQEAFTRFNPDGTLIGFTGCKNFNGAYQTEYNRLTISAINLAAGACPDSALQTQEDAFVAILRSARSYFVADTTLQVAGDSGFLNFSLTPVSRPEELQPPQAVIRAVPQAEAGQVVVFDGAASSGQAPIVGWKWDFGDRSSASGPVVQHIYRDPGAYIVRLTVSDQRGKVGTAEQHIHILAQPVPTGQPTQLPSATPVPPSPTPVPPTATPEPPTATPEPPPQPDPPQASLSGPRNGYIGEPVTFDASASQPGGSPIVSYRWSFGDGQERPPSLEVSATVTYNRAGDYEVSVFVQDANGLSSYATARITIGARLETSVWSLSTLNGRPLLPGTAITLQFLNGQLSGFAGCNSYSGRYTATDNGDGAYDIAIQGVSTSRAACPQEVMDQESAYLAALQEATTAFVQENQITLNSPPGPLVFFLVTPR